MLLPGGFCVPPGFSLGVYGCRCLSHGLSPAEDLSDSDEVFAKEMTKWNSNDFLDTLERPGDLDEGLGECGPGSGVTTYDRVGPLPC